MCHPSASKAMDPKILLLDEPTSALDPELIGEVIAVIKALAVKGMTMVMATHQISLISSLADEILFMQGGRIVEQGSPAALLSAGNPDRRWHHLITHDVPPEVHKFSALQRLGHEVSPHLVGGTKYDFKVLLFHLVSKEEETDVKRARSLASTLSAIDFE